MEPTQNQKLPLFTNDPLENLFTIPTCFEKQINFWKREIWEHSSGERKQCASIIKKNTLILYSKIFEYLLQAK